MLVPVVADEFGPIAPAELAAWVDVAKDRDPEIAGHEWRVDLDDAVGLLVDQATVDLEQLLGQQVGVESVVQLDREVLVVHAPTLCADGLRATVIETLASANRGADAGGLQLPGASRVREDRSDGLTTPSTGAAEARPDPPEDACLLVGDPVHSEGHIVQVWVCQEGVLVLPTGTLSHPTPPNRWHRLSATQGQQLAAQHDGRWIGFASVAQLRLQPPRLVPRSWKATIVDQDGRAASFRWKSDIAPVLKLWAFTVAACGLQRADGIPFSRRQLRRFSADADRRAAGDA